MKRRLLIVLTALFSALILFSAGCVRMRAVYTASGNNDFGIELSAKNMTDKGMTLVIKKLDNRNYDEAVTGGMYTIEQYKNGQWKALEEKKSICWDLKAYSITAERKLELDVKWDYIYGELSDGRYRIAKDFFTEHMGKKETYYLEFVVE